MGHKIGFLYGKNTVKIANDEMQQEILGDCLEGRKSKLTLSPSIPRQD